MSTPDLIIQQISDRFIRKNFELLKAYFDAQNQLLDFKFFEAVFTEAETGAKKAHGLPSIPLDILVTHLTGTGTVTFKYGEFDSTYLVMDVSGPCRIRFFAGTCIKVATSTVTGASDSQKFISGV